MAKKKTYWTIALYSFRAFVLTSHCSEYKYVAPTGRTTTTTTTTTQKLPGRVDPLWMFWRSRGEQLSNCWKVLSRCRRFCSRLYSCLMLCRICSETESGTLAAPSSHCYHQWFKKINKKSWRNIFMVFKERRHNSQYIKTQVKNYWRYHSICSRHHTHTFL